jgi:PleD family two-component response regulator
MNQTNQVNQKTVLVAVSDIFFYTKVRDALLPAGFRLERVRAQDEMKTKTASLNPCAVILNMNEDRLDPFQALRHVRESAPTHPIPVLAFANHEETETWRRAKDLGATKIVSRNEFSARTRELVEEVISQPLIANSE